MNPERAIRTYGGDAIQGYYKLLTPNLLRAVATCSHDVDRFNATALWEVAWNMQLKEGLDEGVQMWP